MHVFGGDTYTFTDIISHHSLPPKFILEQAPPKIKLNKFIDKINLYTKQIYISKIIYSMKKRHPESICGFFLMYKLC